jgi:hypothetical protein
VGLNTIPARVGTIVATFWDDIRTRWIGDFVGMDASGAPVAGCNLGNPLYPWGAAYFGSAVIGGSALDVSQIETQPYKVVSGAKRSTSNQPDFLRAAGSGTNFTVRATTTPLVLQIAGVTATWTVDKVVAGTVAPSSQNTATVNDATAASQAATRTWGEYGSGAGTAYYPITVNSMGTNMTAKVGTWQALKYSGEIFLGYIESTTSISRAFRGFFLDDSGNPSKRSVIGNGNPITLLSLGWVFLDADGTTADTAYTNPTFGYSSPSSPATGDYWFDQGNQVWKRYNGSSFVQVSRTLVGLVVLDATNCVASRSFDFFALVRSDNTMEIERTSNTVVKGSGLFSRVNVNGRRINFSTSRAVWDTASNLAASTDRYNASVTASVTEYFYVTDAGETKISDFEPYWRADLLGWYHPHNTWRCVGQVTPDGSANFTTSFVSSYGSANLFQTLVQLVIGRAGGPALTQFGTDSLTANIAGRPAVVSASPATRGLMVVRGSVTLAGALAGGEGFSVVRNGAGSGLYTVTFTSAFADTPMVVTILGAVGVTLPGSISTTGFTCNTYNMSSVGTDNSWQFIAIGQRAT